MILRSKTPHEPGAPLYCDEFSRGRTYRTRRTQGTQDWLMIFTADGSGRLGVASGEAYLTRPGDVVLYPPGSYHDYGTNATAGHWHILWAHFLPKPSWHPWLRWPEREHGLKLLHLRKGETRESFAAAMRRMFRIFRRRLPNAEDFAANALEEALLWAHATATQEPWIHTDPRVRKAMDYLAAHLSEPFRLETVARHCGLSVSRLAHLFKSEARLSPQQFFEQQRMWRASQLLRLTDLGITEIAGEVGYEDPFYFSNRFRRYAGKSPTKFRDSTTSASKNKL